MENETLATEIIKELKAHGKRWFVISVIELGIILVLSILIVMGLLWYFSLPVEEVDIQNESGNANYIGRDLEGDLYNGTDYSKEESSQE